MKKSNDYKTAANKEKLLMSKAQTEILDGIKTGWPAFYVDPPKKEVTSARYSALSDQQLDNGVRALVLACNLSGGSVGDVQIYELMRAYLKNPQVRAQINALVEVACRRMRCPDIA